MRERGRLRSASCEPALAASVVMRGGTRTSGTVLDPPLCAAGSLGEAREEFRSPAGIELDLGHTVLHTVQL